MSNETFVAFLRTGELNRVRVGSGRDQVEERFGAPSETSKLRRGLFLWAYGQRALRVTLERDRVVLIGVYVRYGLGGLPTLFPDGPPFSIGSDRGEIERKLAEWNVPWSVRRDMPGTYDIGDGGVVAVFRDDGVLESFQVS